MKAKPDLLALIGLIYDAAEDASGWPRLLQSISETLDGIPCGLVIDDRRGGRSQMHQSHGLDPHYLNQYETYYGRIDAWVAAGWPHYATAGVFPSHESITDEAMRESEFYNDFLSYQDLFYAMPGIIAKSDGMTAIITFVRSANAGPFEAAEAAMLRALLPHLQRAVRIQQRLGLATRSVEALDSITIGLLFCTSEGKVLLGNRYAREILELKDGIHLNRDSVLSADSEPRIFVNECARTAATSRGRGRHAGSAFTVDRPSGKRPYCVQASPLRRLMPLMGREQATVLFFISDPEKQKETDAALLQRLFSLTPAEASVAATLMLGHDLDRTCEYLSITRNTGRAHLRSLFTKLRVKRQAELVALLLRAVGQVRVI